MKDIITVTKFAINDMIKRKSFIISTIIILILIVVGFNIPNLINSLDSESYKQNITIVDKDNIFENNLELLKDLELNYNLNIENKDLDELKEEISSKKIDGALIVENNNGNINLNYIILDMSLFYEAPEDLVETLNTLYHNIQLNKLSLTEEELALISTNLNFTVEPIKDEASGNILVVMMLSVVLFMAIYFCAYQVSSSITIEKTSKIIETLVTSTSPRNIIVGKTLGIGLVGLTQMLIVVITAIISANLFLDKELLSLILDVSNFNLFLLIMIIIYFISGYFIYALLYALTGSTVSKPEDIQSANIPISILVIIGFYLSYLTMMNPNSNLNFFAAIFPLSSPFCMPFRVMMGVASVKEIILSLVIIVITIILIAKVAIKIYSNAILNYGTKLSIKELINMYKSK